MGTDVAPKRLVSRVFNLLVFLIGLIITSVISATITTSLTVASLSQASGISSLNDLANKRVGVVNSTTSQSFMSNRGGSILVPYPDLATLKSAFLDQEGARLDAVVFDDPILRYFVRNDGVGEGVLVGPMFADQKYGIAFPFGSPVRVRVNEALLNIQETGLDKVFYEKWFGSSDADKSNEAGGGSDMGLLAADDTTLAVIWGAVGLCFILIGIVFAHNKHRRIRKARSSSIIQDQVSFSMKAFGLSASAVAAPDEQNNNLDRDTLSSSILDPPSSHAHPYTPHPAPAPAAGHVCCCCSNDHLVAEIKALKEMMMAAMSMTSSRPVSLPATPSSPASPPPPPPSHDPSDVRGVPGTISQDDDAASIRSRTSSSSSSSLSSSSSSSSV
eukprot:TRINITY_DN9548_c0_g1_i2.p1 TRINITY_DN9548_c0_g1~~TRINITY_DN9548_c0_g1_i2.p1  ORF type:complete len:387 (-),score=104.00 TRINITY_DN9548_c0_g1_i2:61-1221(-)